MDGFQWSSKKAKSNLAKHGVDFADVTPVFDDETAVTVDDETRGRSGS